MGIFPKHFLYLGTNHLTLSPQDGETIHHTAYEGWRETSVCSVFPLPPHGAAPHAPPPLGSHSPFSLVYEFPSSTTEHRRADLPLSVFSRLTHGVACVGTSFYKIRINNILLFHPCMYTWVISSLGLLPTVHLCTDFCADVISWG